MAEGEDNMGIEARWSDCLFVIVPGIGGSVLERGVGENAEKVWGHPTQAGKRILSPSALEVGQDDDIRAVGAMSDWTLLRKLIVVHGYSGLVRSVMNTTKLKVDWGHPDKPIDDAQVVVFPWDFRRSIEVAATKLDAEIRRRLKKAGGSTERRVVIIGHSMGGLVARAWARGDAASQMCRAIVTLGTPHLGAPKALHTMANGLSLGPIPVASRLSTVLRSWPSLYELLPIYRMIETQGSELVRPADLVAPWLNQNETTRALEMHTTMLNDWKKLIDPPSVVAVTGVGRPTWERASMADGSTTFRKGPIGDDNLHGDGTVPRVAGVPHEQNNWANLSSQRISVGTSHGQISNWNGLNSELNQIVLLKPAGVVLGDADRQLALNLEATWPTDEPLPLQARIFDQNGQTTSALDTDKVATVRARVTTNGVETGWTEMHADGDAWATTLPPLAAGVTRVQVQATTQDGFDPPEANEEFVVVEQEDVEESDAV